MKMKKKNVLNNCPAIVRTSIFITGPMISMITILYDYSAKPSKTEVFNVIAKIKLVAHSSKLILD